MRYLMIGLMRFILFILLMPLLFFIGVIEIVSRFGGKQNDKNLFDRMFDYLTKN